MIAQKARKRVYASDYYVIPRRTRGGSGVLRVYNALGNLTETRYPDGTKSTNVYDVMGRLIESVPRHGVKTSYAYDAAGRVTKVTEGERVTRYAYDLAGNVTKVTLPDGSETTYRYDANNNPIRVIDALGSETSYRYDTMGRLLSVRQPNGATLRLRYDLAGNLTQETDAMGGKQVYAYDALGRLTEVTDALGGTTRYGYDALDNLTLVTDANGHETRYAYDPLSRLRTETDARGNTTAYDYTPEGWLKQTKRPDGTTLSYTYDKTGYLLKETASDGTEIRHTFDALGELTEIEDETGTTKLRYDERGLLIGVENPLGDVVQYTYNAYGEKTGITYPDGKQATYTYDALSRLLSVTEPNGTTTEYTYDALGRRTSTTDGTATTAYRYDKVGNLTKQTNDAVTLTYKYDLNGRMTGETRAEGKTVTRTNYAYDKAGQLLSFRRSDGNAERYKYDPAGNMVEKTQNGVKIAMTYTAANELQSMESPHGKLVYAYDQNGNLTQKTYNGRTDTYSYDVRNHLRQYRGYDNYTVKYSYNALGMLHAKESTGSNSRTTLEELIAGKEASDDPDGDAEPRTTTYVYDLTQPYYEVLTESTDGKVTSYTYGLERLAAYTEQAQTKYLYDGRGSVAQTIQTNNGSFADAIRSSKAYSPFGELLTEKTSGYGFNGEYYDAATGMLNLRARQYEPAQGRFSQKDSEKGHVANARSLNAYLYCYNDAVNLFDASGAKPEVVRNSVTVDPGGSSAARVASTAQNGASANTVANTSPTKSAATGAKVANHAAVSIGYAEKGSESSAVSDAQLEYAFKQGRMPTVGDNSILKEATKGACTSGIGIAHGGHSGKFGPFGSHGGHSGDLKRNPFYELKDRAEENIPIIYQSGFGGSVAFGAQGTGSIVVAIDTKGNVAIMVTYGAGGGSPSAGVYKINAISIADSVFSLEGATDKSLEGISGTIGGSGLVYGPFTAGGEFSYGLDKNKKNTYSVAIEGGVSAKIPIPAEIHGGATNTKILINRNVYESLGIIYDFFWRR